MVGPIELARLKQVFSLLEETTRVSTECSGVEKPTAWWARFLRFRMRTAGAGVRAVLVPCFLVSCSEGLPRHNLAFIWGGCPL